jgi:hypothetical protein
MAYYNPWLDYGGAARIWLAVALLALAGGLVYAGIRLPLPVQATRAGKKTVIVTLAAWIIAVVVLLAAVVVYVRQYAQQRSAAGTPYPDHVAPVTFSAVLVLFVIILIGSQSDIGPRLAGAVIGAIAAPFITTLLLPGLSPMVRLNRTTFYAFALMLAVFAVWALAGFGYPSAPVPLTLNIVSKLLAFVTALTLFFPQKRTTTQLPD